MTRMVNCRKLKQSLPGLQAPPLPGPKGIELYEQISQQAWDAWLKHQTMLINEKHLSMLDPEARKYLSGQMEKFFSGDEYDQAEGYIPPEQSDP